MLSMFTGRTAEIVIVSLLVCTTQLGLQQLEAIECIIKTLLYKRDFSCFSLMNFIFIVTSDGTRNRDILARNHNTILGQIGAKV